ncbi:MAG: hypothetical protein HY286_00180 [Planctomycetes bacterium]|nr:hypothetical protein [Planctomycetota bacterium]
MSAAPARRPSHAWKFFRAGGFDQVRLDSAADLAALPELDQKLWVALACPTRGIEFDPVTLDLIDSDKDGRIRVPELIAAIQWTCGLLKNPDDLLKGLDSVALAAINDGIPEGKVILASAKQLLSNIGKTGAAAISAADTTDTTKSFSLTKFNGDGIVPAEAADDPALASIITDILACIPPVTDRSGKPGINDAILTEAFKQLSEFAAWQAKGDGDAAILAIKGGAAAAAAAYKSVKLKIDDYFSRCRLAAFDARALAALNRHENEYLTIAAKDLSVDAAEIAGFPIARVEAGKSLPLAQGVNPAWAAAIANFRNLAVKPTVGDKDNITETDWRAIGAALAPYDTWLQSKPATKFESLGIARIREILQGKARDAIAALIAADKALESEFNAISSVDRFVRYHRDLYRLSTNFVNFRDFYDNEGEAAVFQSGTLYLDQRSCNLCIRVEDMAKHGAMASLSKTFLAYCDVSRKSTGEKMTIAAAFTDGDSDNLMVGRNGIFYDRKGNDWDATITKIVEHPISIRQAFWSPYKKIASLIQSQIEKMAASREKAVQDKAAANITQTSTTVEAAAAKSAEEKKDDAIAKKEEAKKEAFDVAKFAGIFAAIGLALGAIGAALTALIKGFFELELWQMPLAVAGIMLIISGPSMIIAWLKLRQRNLGPILDANGWAINAKAKVNIPFGRSLTGVAKLPAGSSRDLTDNYADSTAGRKWLIAAAILFIVFCVWKYRAIKSLGDMFGFTPPAWTYCPEPSPDAKAKEDATKK